ncbi:hypothetical protein AB3N02_13865 [Priestia aryabhattai]|uniref:portal protein n=1 Tax=Priestia aryabhattai TaxID=412384 RepID=UPI0039A30518
MENNMIERATRVEKEYKQALDYKRQMGFLAKWAEYERFKAGDQWPAPTDNTKMLPRPVFNIIEQIQSHKVASIMNENIKVVYTALDADEPDPDANGGEGVMASPEWEGADKFTRYSESVWENIKQDQLNEEMLEVAANLGSGIIHYYWDASKIGGNKMKYQGEICGEIIDPVNFFPGNPQSTDVQKQPYIIITSRELIRDVKKQAADNGVPPEKIEEIKSDKETVDQAYDMAQHEQDGADKITVLTRYYKRDGKIYFVRVASGVIIKDETDTGLKRYPIALMNWKRRKQSIFGVGDTEGLIPNQKAVNFLMAMQLLSTQLTGWPKMIVNRSYVKQRIQNVPGEIIYSDAPPGSAPGVDYMNPAAMPSHIPDLVDNFIGYTKETAGANENAMGENSSSDLNATAIIQLQKAAGIPLESIKRRFYQAMEDVGLIWMEFWKVKYNTERLITIKDDDNQNMTVPFTGTEYADVDMKVKIDIGPSSSYSETLMMSSLDKFLDMQLIDFETYLKYAPKNVVPFRDRLLKDIEQKKKEAEQMGEEQFEQILQTLSPEEQQAFMNAPPELQEQMKQQILAQQEQQAPGGQSPMGGMPQAQQGAPQQ